MSDVVLSWVSGSHVGAKFSHAVDILMDFDRKTHQLIAERISHESSLIDLNRNRCVYTFLNDPRFESNSYFFFVDSDMVFLPHQFYGLYYTAKTRDLDVVAGMYFGLKNGIITPNWYLEGGPRAYHSVPEVEGKLMELGAVAMGFTFIHRRVLEAMWEYDNFASWFTHDLVLGADGQRDSIGEDLSFCRRAREKGFKVWGDPSIGAIGHEKPVVLDLTWFLMQRNWLEAQNEKHRGSETKSR